MELNQMVRCLCSKWASLLCVMFLCIGLKAQDANVGALPAGKDILRTSLMGVGYQSTYDTYLSPNVYGGAVVSVASESTTLVGELGRRSYLKVWTKADFGMLDDKSGRGGEMSFKFDTHESKIWMLYDDVRFSLLGGYSVNLLAGGVYNMRNSNNPVQGKFQVGGGLAALGLWRFQVRNFPFAVRCSFDMSLLGFGFSPEYGQLYYEIYKSESMKSNFFLSHPFNSDDYDGMVMLDIPAGLAQVRAGVELRGYGYKVNNLKYSQTDVAFMVGVVRKLEYKYNGRNK